MNNQKPANIGNCEWKNIQRAIGIITEHFPNMALFINWVDDEGETQHAYILQGNKFALHNHIGKWVDGDFDPPEQQDEEEYS